MRKRQYYIPSGSVRVADKQSDAVAYVYERPLFYAAVFFGEQSKPVYHTAFRTAEKREQAVRTLFEQRRAHLTRKANDKAERKAKAVAFAAELEVGDIFHYSFGYDETHHVFFEVTAIDGRYATVRKIRQAQQELGYDHRHRCQPQSGDYCGEPVRVLLQDGRIKVDRHYHASKWNTGRVAGVPVGPTYSGGGMH